MNDLTVFDELFDKFREGKLAHAFLFETNDFDKCFLDVILLIKKISCPSIYSDKCSEDCNLCNLIDDNNLPSLVVIEPDGQFIKKDQILNMMNEFSTKPVFSKFNIYIVKDASKFNSSSANTLLKFLEEPEENILGFFLTENKETVISTIRSRCQIYNCIYNIEDNDVIDDNYLINVKLYLNSIYKNDDDLLYNKLTMGNIYNDRYEWEKFFNTMFYYIVNCCSGKRNDVIDLIKEVNDRDLINIILLIESTLKYIKSNGNIDLILDNFVIEMRKYYG